MIVDVHTRIWNEGSGFAKLMANQLRRRDSQPWQRTDTDAEAHKKAMEPIGAGFVLGFESAAMDVAIPDEQISKYVTEAGEKLIGFSGIDPLAGKLKNKLKSLRDNGLKGATINPAAQALHPAHTKALKLYELCENENLPLIIEGAADMDGAAKLEFDQPYLLDEVAQQFPNLKMILTSVDDSWINQAMMLASRHKHIYIDLSAQIDRPWALYKFLVSGYQRGVIDKIFFSSNFPFVTPENAILTLYSTNTLVQGSNLPSIPREQLRSIVERDVLGILGLASPQKEETEAEEVKAEG